MDSCDNGDVVCGQRRLVSRIGEQRSNTRYLNKVASLDRATYGWKNKLFDAYLYIEVATISLVDFQYDDVGKKNSMFYDRYNTISERYTIIEDGDD